VSQNSVSTASACERSTRALAVQEQHRHDEQPEADPTQGAVNLGERSPDVGGWVGL
jgi:hypothetical protein